MSHLVTVPSTTDSPSCGMITFVAMDDLCTLLSSRMMQSNSRQARGQRAILVGSGMNQSCIGWLYGTPGTSGPARRSHRRIEVGEGLLRDDGGDLGAVAAGQVVLVHDERLAGLAHRGQDRLLVDRRQRAQVDNLDIDPFSRHGLSRLQGVVMHHAIGKQAQVRARARNAGRADRHQHLFAFRDLAFDQAVALLGLKEHHGVGIAHRRLEQSLGVVGSGRDDDLQAGDMGIEGLDRL